MSTDNSSSSSSSLLLLLRPGSVVETLFGVGVVIAHRPSAAAANDDTITTTTCNQGQGQQGGMVQVALGRLPGRSIGTAYTAYLQPSAILGSLPVAPGMTTMTKDDDEISKKVLIHTYLSSQKRYLVSYADDEDAAAVAAIMPHLNALAAAAAADDDNDNDDSEFFDAEEEDQADVVVSTLSNEDKTTQTQQKKPVVVLLSYTPDQLHPSKGAKFYPLLLELMKRGDMAAAQVGGYWHQNKDVIHKVTSTIQQTTTHVTDKVACETHKLLKGQSIDERTEQVVSAAETAVHDLTTQLQQQAVPSSAVQEHVQKVMDMLKKEEFTVLLQHGKERLEQLVLVSADIPQTTQVALHNIGISWKTTTTSAATTTTTTGQLEHNKALEQTQQKALQAVDDLLQTVQQVAREQGLDISGGGGDKQQLSLKDLDWKQFESQFQELQLDQKFQTMFDHFVQASKSDRTLSGIMEHVAQHTTEWQQMTGRLLATKSGSLFLEGASRIQARAGLILSGGGGGLTSTTKNSVDLQQWTQSMTTKFTKAFTEGDAAVARLKSIELGDAVRQRLVAAIEIRSDSLGGLDGIIARALGALETGTKKASKAVKKRVNQDTISTLLANLQSSASGKGKEAHETLISVLSRKSLYRDIAMLKLERTFCDLEEQFFGASWNSEDSWSAEDLAKLARGEGGTAALFEPIAKRAKQEIDKQLDNAEAAVQKQQEARGGNDPNADMVLEALRRVRKIMSGELTVNAIVEDVVNLLNDDKIVSAGEDLIQRGERVLDAIEGVSNNLNNANIDDPTNKLISDAMQIAQKAGITKDSVMKELEKIDVDEMLDTAQGAVTDEKKRRQLLSQATDAALDFFLKILPSMPVPPFEGVKDGLVYHLSNLSMEGFKVKKENIIVEIAGMRATTDPNKRKSSGGTLSMDAVKEAVKGIPPAATAGTALSAPDSGSSLVDDDSDNDSFVSQTELDIETTADIGHVKATELLIIAISDVSAVLDGANWSFEQTYFPYLKGSGASDVRLANGNVRLQFELRKRKRKIKTPKAGASGEDSAETEEKEIWEPVLCLHDRSCQIGEVFVSLQGEGKIAWILNKLSGIFKGPIGTYVARQIVAVMSNRSGVILDKLNNVLSPYWDLILSTAGLKMDDLVEADHRVVTNADSEDKENTIELVWRERVPLGLNLLLNDESGQVKVVDLPRGSQARKVCEARKLDPAIFQGATILAVNGCRFFEPEEVYDALRDPIRPKTVLFELAESAEAARVEEFVADAMNEKQRKIKEAAVGGASQEQPEAESYRSGPPEKRTFETRTFEITEPGDIGIEFGESLDNCGLVVCGFVKKDDGSSSAAEQSGVIHINDLLTHINGKLVLGDNGVGRNKAFEILQAEGATRPLSMSFADPYLMQQVFEASPSSLKASVGGPTELCLEESVAQLGGETGGTTKRIVLSSYQDTDGVAETSGILIGDYLVFVNGKSVGAGSRWLGESPPSLEEVYTILRNPAEYPMGITFARPKKSSDLNMSWSGRARSQSSNSPGRGQSTDQFDDDEAETVAVNTERLEMLGCVFDLAEGSENDVIVTDFYAVPGLFQKTLSPLTGPSGRKMKKLAIESINGQFVPSYASKDIVMNAMKRSWSKDRRVEIMFCDDELKAWLHSLVHPMPKPSPAEDECAAN